MAAEERVCPHCGRIVHGHGNARFCGEACRRAWEQRHGVAEDTDCGEDFLYV